MQPIYISIFPNVGSCNRLHLNTDETSLYMNYYKGLTNDQPSFIRAYLTGMKEAALTYNVIYVSSNPKLRAAMLNDEEIKSRLIVVYPKNTLEEKNKLLSKLSVGDKFYSDVNTFWNIWHENAKQQCQLFNIPYFEIESELDLKNLISEIKNAKSLDEFK